MFVSVSGSCVFFSVFFWNAHKSSRCVCGRGISERCLQHYVAPVILQRRVIDYSDHSTDCFTLISFWPYRWEITSTAERMIGGKRDAPNLLSHYRRPDREDWREWVREGQKGQGEKGGRARQTQTEGERERREGLINKGGEWEGAKRLKNVEKQEPKWPPNSDVYFIWGGRCAGSTTSHCCSGPFPLAVWLA